VTAADRVIRWAIAGAVVGVTAVATVVSCKHASSLVWRMVSRVDGPPFHRGRADYPSSIAMLDSARRSVRVPVLARVARTDG
jgi:hypothetical protein